MLILKFALEKKVNTFIVKFLFEPAIFWTISIQFFKLQYKQKYKLIVQKKHFMLRNILFDGIRQKNTPKRYVTVWGQSK